MSIEIVGVHPIVVVTISDFYNRMKISSGNQKIRVYGALMGLRTQNKVEIFSSFEFENTSKDPEKCEFDKTYIETRRELATQLYPKYDIIGFYSTNNSDEPGKGDLDIMDTLLFFGITSPIFLILNTNENNSGKFPLFVYEFDKDNKEKSFRKINYQIDSSESERICLDTVTKSAGFNEEQSGLIQNYTILKNAVTVYENNLNLILNNLEKFKDDSKFMSILNDILWNIPKTNESDYNQKMEQKKKEILIFNNICASVINKSYQGRTSSIKTEK